MDRRERLQVHCHKLGATCHEEDFFSVWPPSWTTTAVRGDLPLSARSGKVPDIYLKGTATFV